MRNLWSNFKRELSFKMKNLFWNIFYDTFVTYFYWILK